MTRSRRLARTLVSALLALGFSVLALGALAPRPPLARDSSSEGDTAQAHRFSRAGATLLSAGKPIEALRQFQNASMVDPDDSEIHYAQGLCLLRLDEPAKARDQFL